MIKKYFIISISVLIFSNLVFSQSIPRDFQLNSNLKKLNKGLSSATPSSNGISDIVTIGDTILVGTGGGLSISTDNGSSWENFINTNNFSDDGISTVNYDKYTNTIWVATARPYNSDIDMGTGLHYSTDLGKTWTDIPQPVDGSGDSLFVYGINDGIQVSKVHALPVTVTPGNVTYDFAFTPGTVWITSWSSGLRKSTNKGQTWQRVLLPSDSLNSLQPTDTVRFSLRPKAGNEGWLNHMGFSVVSVNDSTLYVGTVNGINKTTNANDTLPQISWVKFNHQNQANPIGGDWVVGLGYNEYNKTIWGATQIGENTDHLEKSGVSFSSDGGKSWQTSLDGSKVYNFGFKNNDVIAASTTGAFRSSDMGISWILPNSIVDEKSGTKITTVAFYAASVSKSNNFVWLGSDEGLARLNETTNIMWSGEWKIYFASQSLASQSETHAFPNPFSPRLDSKLNIKYSTGGKNEKVTIRIFNFSMSYVATVIQNADRAETGLGNGVIDYWNGKDDSGNMVPNGVYFYRVEVGSNDPIYGKILVIQ